MVGLAPNDQRLDNPLFPDRGGQFLQLVVVEAFTGLIGVRLELLDRAEKILAVTLLGRRTEQGADPLAEGGTFSHGQTSQI